MTGRSLAVQASSNPSVKVNPNIRRPLKLSHLPVRKRTVSLSVRVMMQPSGWEQEREANSHRPTGGRQGEAGQISPARPKAAKDQAAFGRVAMSITKRYFTSLLSMRL
ncbi:hypothetical protein AcidC75_13360 [Acidisoma sp. C75]